MPSGCRKRSSGRAIPLRKASTSRPESIGQAKMVNRPRDRAAFAVRIQVLKDIGRRSSERPSALLDRWHRDRTWAEFSRLGRRQAVVRRDQGAPGSPPASPESRRPGPGRHSRCRHSRCRHSRDMFWRAPWGESQPELARAGWIGIEIDLPGPFPAAGSHIGASADRDREQNPRGGAYARPAGSSIFGSRLTHFGDPVFAPARDSPASSRRRRKIFSQQLGYNLGFLYIQ